MRTIQTVDTGRQYKIVLYNKKLTTGTEWKNVYWYVDLKLACVFAEGMAGKGLCVRAVIIDNWQKPAKKILDLPITLRSA